MAWVPRRIEDDHTIRTDQIDPKPSSFGRNQEQTTSARKVKQQRSEEHSNKKETTTQKQITETLPRTPLPIFLHAENSYRLFRGLLKRSAYACRTLGLVLPSRR